MQRPTIIAFPSAKWSADCNGYKSTMYGVYVNKHPTFTVIFGDVLSLGNSKVIAHVAVAHMLL